MLISSLSAIPTLYVRVGAIAGVTHRVGQLLEALLELEVGLAVSVPLHRLQRSLHPLLSPPPPLVPPWMVYVTYLLCTTMHHLTAWEGARLRPS